MCKKKKNDIIQYSGRNVNKGTPLISKVSWQNVKLLRPICMTLRFFTQQKRQAGGSTNATAASAAATCLCTFESGTTDVSNLFSIHQMVRRRRQAPREEAPSHCDDRPRHRGTERVVQESKGSSQEDAPVASKKERCVCSGRKVWQ